MPTDFHGYTYEQLTAMIADKDPGSLTDMSGRFSTAVQKVQDAMHVLVAKTNALDWQGADADAFRGWVTGMIFASAGLTNYLSTAKTSLDIAADQLQKTVIPPQDAQSVQLLSALNGQSMGYAMATDPTGMSNAIDQANATLQNQHTAAADSMSALADAYTAATTHLASWSPPTFPPPPQNSYEASTPIDVTSPPAVKPGASPAIHPALAAPRTSYATPAGAPTPGPGAPQTISTSAPIPQSTSLLSNAPLVASSATPSAGPFASPVSTPGYPASGPPVSYPSYVAPPGTFYSVPSTTPPPPSTDLRGGPSEVPDPDNSPGITGGTPVESHTSPGFMPGGGNAGGPNGSGSARSPRQSGVTGGDVGAEDAPGETSTAFSPGGTGLLGNRDRNQATVGGVAPAGSGDNRERKRRKQPPSYLHEDQDSWTTGQSDGVVPPVIG